MRRVWMASLIVIAGVSGLVAQPKQPQPKSQKEVEAIQAMFSAQDPDSRIKAATELITKFADTEFRGTAYYVLAVSYEQKNDFANMVVWAEKTLEADPKNFATMLMLAGGTAKRTTEHDLDREEKLASVEKYAKSALETLKTAEKPRPDIADEQWTAIKKDYEAQAHEAFALVAQVRKKHDVAIAEFKLAIEGAANPDPTTMVRLAQVYNQSGKHDDAIALLDKVMSAADIHPAIKQFAQAERVRALQAKGAVKPATPTGPPAPVPPAEKKQ